MPLSIWRRMGIKRKKKTKAERKALSISHRIKKLQRRLSRIVEKERRRIWALRLRQSRQSVSRWKRAYL